jgi:hypothetical protein
MCKDVDHPNPACIVDAVPKKREGRTRASSLRNRQTSMPKRSAPRMSRESYLQGAKDATIFLMVDQHGCVFCQHCGTDGPIDFMEARTWLNQHHHDTERDEGRGYDFVSNKPGSDHPSGILYVCSRCHTELGGT